MQLPLHRVDHGGRAVLEHGLDRLDRSLGDAELPRDLGFGGGGNESCFLQLSSNLPVPTPLVLQLLCCDLRLACTSPVHVVDTVRTLESTS